MTVTDDDGAATTSTLDITVSNVTPTITQATGDRLINEGDTANFKASATDPGNDTLIYTWNFGDSTELTGESVEHIFVDNGEYDVNLTVTDDDGASATQTLTITVNNVAPTVEIGEDRTSDEGNLVEFNASFSDRDSLDTHTIAWNFGDGTTATDTLTPSHIYIDNGEYKVTLTVTDNDGAATTVDLTVTVNNIPPAIASITGDTKVSEGDIANFSALATDPGDDKLTYTWDFRDGTEPVTGQDVTHIYTDDGNYTVDLLQKSDLKCDRERVGRENNELPNSQKSETRRIQTLMWCE